MSDEQINAWDDQWNAEKQALAIEKQQVAIKRLREALASVIMAYEMAGYIFGKQPDSVTKTLIDAKQTLKETE